MNNPGNVENTAAISTPAQLNDLRLKQWHQNGEALLTFENLRSWINAAGLVLFAPRPQILSPAPSFVEATLGTPNHSPNLAQISDARALLARLISEGVAVPLNLLGTTNVAAPDMPDFVASTAVFSYLFTLRGDKAWKQPPATSGASKVSNLALAAYEALSRRPLRSAYDLATELGNEVTETAVLRALSELWTHMRVLPLLQADGAPTVWELTNSRFTKQIKAGANAGQPSALSALISLYLGQTIAATEEEISGFLSPLAPRSRTREIAHALLAARQLDTIAIEGRTLLHLSGTLPAVSAEPVERAEAQGETEPAAESGEPQERIKKYIPAPRKVGTGYLAKAKPAGTKQDRPMGRNPPASRDARPGSARPPRRFDKPWTEEPPRRRSPAERGEDRLAPRQDARGERSERREKFVPGRRQETGERSTFRPEGKRFGKAKPRFEQRREGASDTRRDREDRPDRPAAKRPTDFQNRKPFRPKEGGQTSEPRGRRFARPGSQDNARPFRKRSESGERPASGESRGRRFGRPESQDNARPFRRRDEAGERPASSEPRGRRFERPESRGSARPFRKRSETGERPASGDSSFKKRGFAGKSFGERSRSGDRRRDDRGGAPDRGNRFGKTRGESGRESSRPSRGPAGKGFPRKFPNRSSKPNKGESA